MVMFKNPIKIVDAGYGVCGVSTISNPQRNTLVFIQRDYEPLLVNLNAVEGCCVIAEEGMQIPDNLRARHSFIITDNPRLVFAKIYSQLEKEEQHDSDNKAFRNINGAIVGENVVLGTGVVIEPFCFVDHDVVIGANTIIRSGSRIRSRVSIGRNCLVKENAVIGTPGFSFEMDEDGNLVRVPQLGGVTIADNVEVGALATVASGAIEPTVLHDQVKLMDHAHIAHNVEIGRRTVVGSGTTVGGSTRIGRDVWIAPNCAIMHKIAIGNGAVIGLSARVYKDIPPGMTVMNEGAESFAYVREFIKWKQQMLGAPDQGDTREHGRGHPYFR